MTVFTFPYLEEYLEDGTVIFRPYVRIHLQGVDRRWRLFDLYADSGADITLLREADCQALGRELTAGRLLLISGVCTGLIRTFVHEVPLRLGTESFSCPVAFAERAEVPRLLGHAGIFPRFQVCYDDARRVTQFILQEDRL
ncbi:MAG: hypothetical protein FJ026_00510 [Chloroflexi bacterium]|nr:hypothetical protein [Chloroflexota bacterium]